MTWSSRALPFPHNLSEGQRRYIEAVRAGGSIDAAAARLGLSADTVKNGLQKARLRAGVSTTADLLDRYFNAREAISCP